MAASLTLTPSSVMSGRQIPLIEGAGFLPSTKITIHVTHTPSGFDLESNITSDVDGAFAAVDEPDPATGTLTSDATIPTAADTVTISSVVYTFRTSPSVANDVALGANAAAALANLAHAVNADGTAGAYGTGTVANPDVKATTVTATTVKLVARVGGTAGNSLATTETSSHLSFGGATLAGGSAATGAETFKFVPNQVGLVNFSATDGTSTALATLTVFGGG